MEKGSLLMLQMRGAPLIGLCQCYHVLEDDEMKIHIIVCLL